MGDVFAAPRRYKPIRAFELGEAIPFHVAVTVPPPGRLAGVAVRVGPATVVTGTIVTATVGSRTVGADTVGAGAGIGVIVPVVVAVAA
jgi:hypothetical protein